MGGLCPRVALSVLGLPVSLSVCESHRQFPGWDEGETEGVQGVVEAVLVSTGNGRPETGEEGVGDGVSLLDKLQTRRRPQRTPDLLTPS